MPEHLNTSSTVPPSTQHVLQHAAVPQTLLRLCSQGVPGEITKIVNNGKICLDVRKVQRVAVLLHVKLECPSSTELQWEKPQSQHQRRVWMGLPRLLLLSGVAVGWGLS